MLVYFSVVLVLLLGFSGLAIDSARTEIRTIQLQTIADNAALTAVTEYSRGNSTWSTAATNDAMAQGAATGLTGISVAYQYPTVGPYMNDYSTFQANVSQSMPLTFLSLLTHTTSTTANAHAIAMATPCSYFMSPTGNSMWLASTGFSTNCPVYNNSNIVVDYFATYSTQQAKVVGPSSASSLSPHVNPAPIFNAPVLPDPLAYVTAPAFSSCNATGVVITSPTTAYPGTYCGGLSILNTTVNMTAGLYIITGGALVRNSTVTGSGVTIYCTRGGGSGFGTFRIDTNSIWNVNAPVDSSNNGIPGVVIMGDRSWSGGIRDFSVDTSTFRGDGIIYTTHTGLTDSQSHMSGNNYFGVVTDSMYEYASSFTPSTNYSSLPNGNPFHIPARLVQ